MFQSLSDKELDKLADMLLSAGRRAERHALYTYEVSPSDYTPTLHMWRDTRDLMRDIFKERHERWIG